MSECTPRDRVMRLYAIILKALDNPGGWQFYDRQIGEAQRQAFAEVVANALSMAEQLAPSSETSTPAEPPKGLLISIALRLDHGLLLPGFAESEEQHKRRIECALSEARKAWEECTGKGFWSPERNSEYEAMQRPTPLGPYQPPMVYDPKQGKMVKPGGER